MEFVDILNSICNTGGLVILAGLFVYVFITDRKDKKDEKNNNTQLLKELSNSNSNIAESLNLLKMSIDNNTAEYRQHDDRSIQQYNYINEKLIKIEEKLSK